MARHKGHSKDKVCKGSKMSSMSPSDEGPEGDGLAHCADYVDSQSSDIVMKNEVCRKEAPVYEERCDSTDSSDDSASVAPSACVKKRKAKAIKLKDERLDLQCVYVCLWEQCGFESADSNEITRHVNFHSYHTKVKCIGSNILARSKLPVSDEHSADMCFTHLLKSSCDLHLIKAMECKVGREVAQLPELGDSRVMVMSSMGPGTRNDCVDEDSSSFSDRSEESDLVFQVCTLHCAGKNVIPDLPHAFECCWQTCEQTFNNSQIYFNHVEAHVYCNPRGRVVEGGIPCHWSGCMSNSVYPSIWKLAEHVRTHTQEKLVGCPTCGGLFASRARFSYHCMHQVPSELRGYQFRSKKAVNNHLKCPFCDKTCSCPSNLSVHIRYRHLDSKPFKCSSCEYRAKTHHDLKVHWNTHRSDPLYHCKEKGCDFSCRSAYGLRRHCDRGHVGDSCFITYDDMVQNVILPLEKVLCHAGCDQPQYCCHICDSLFQRGSLLTRHLRKRHSICRPSGQCRFRYKQNGDGLFRLLTTDTETMKVTQKVMVLEVRQPFCINEDDPLTQEAGGEILSS
ncbi:histone H4 transcription factor-like [Cryptotermes secundus]|uniref:histone H4 transcription factor-like n=1 Tax=Cryptotermes secundus TaxID=105785 RepID=UPI000CD7AE4D|nr:histone H4 transcription factor-like [Cryptotermes secundus]